VEAGLTREQLAKLVEQWRKVLLPEWRVVLHDKPLEDMDIEDTWAVCRTPDDYLKLQIHFTDKLLETQSNAEIEATVVHEMLHALTRPWRNLLDAIAFDLGNAKTTPLRQQQEHEEEQLVDRLSYLLVAQAHGTEAVGTIKGESKDDED
jgi:hypothetical protein